MMPFGGQFDEIGTAEDFFGVPRTETPPHMTMLSLVTTLGDQVASDTEVVQIAADLIESGRVVLTGNFAGCKVSFRNTP